MSSPAHPLTWPVSQFKTTESGFRPLPLRSDHVSLWMSYTFYAAVIVDPLQRHYDGEAPTRLLLQIAVRLVSHFMLNPLFVPLQFLVTSPPRVSTRLIHAFDSLIANHILVHFGRRISYNTTISGEAPTSPALYPAPTVTLELSKFYSLQLHFVVRTHHPQRIR